MRILVEPSDYPELQNLGDIAMQKTALDRIAGFWPNSEIFVLTDCPATLPRYAANVHGLSALGRDVWNSGMLPHRLLPDSVRYWGRHLRSKHVQFFTHVVALKLRILTPEKHASFHSFHEAVRDSDLLVVCGMGGITDVFEEYALNLLDTMELVKRNRKSLVVMLGQAFGPIADRSAVAKRAQEVLPQVDFIALREGRASIPLLKRLSVDLSRVMVTGDDALQLAAEDRQQELGDCVGINLRTAFYSKITLEHLSQLRAIIQQFAWGRRAPLLPLPSSFRPEEADMNSIGLLSEGYESTLKNAVTSPASLRSQAQKCRIALVGSYHAGIFALAQGIPIVAMYRSDYYRDKFLGLEDLFGVGVYLVDLAMPDWSSHLIAQATRAWDCAPSQRNVLVQVVDTQIQLGWKAYNRVRQLVQDRYDQPRNE